MSSRSLSRRWGDHRLLARMKLFIGGECFDFWATLKVPEGCISKILVLKSEGRLPEPSTVSLFFISRVRFITVEMMPSKCLRHEQWKYDCWLSIHLKVKKYQHATLKLKAQGLYNPTNLHWRSLFSYLSPWYGFVWTCSTVRAIEFVCSVHKNTEICTVSLWKGKLGLAWRH